MICLLDIYIGCLTSAALHLNSSLSYITKFSFYIIFILEFLYMRKTAKEKVRGAQKSNRLKIL